MPTEPCGNECFLRLHLLELDWSFWPGVCSLRHRTIVDREFSVALRLVVQVGQTVRVVDPVAWVHCQLVQASVALVLTPSPSEPQPQVWL